MIGRNNIIQKRKIKEIQVQVNQEKENQEEKWLGNNYPKIC